MAPPPVARMRRVERLPISSRVASMVGVVMTPTLPVGAPAPSAARRRIFTVSTMQFRALGWGEKMWWEEVVYRGQRFCSAGENVIYSDGVTAT